MAIVIGGHETGLLDGSLTILDRGDRTRNTDPGAGEQIYVNVASGNLTIQNQDIYMPSLGQDYELVRTYNSRPIPAYEVRLPDDRWAMTYNVFIMDKTINGQTNYEVTYADGSTLLYRWDASINAYKSIDGAGAFEVMVELTNSGGELQPWYEVTRADQSRLIFSKHGRLLEWVDTNGVKTEYSYTAQLHLSQVRDDQGHVIDYVYANNRVVRVDHNVYGTLVEYSYNNDGRLTSVTDRNGHVTRYYYNSGGYLSRIELPDRQVVDGQLQTFEARVYEFEYEVPPIDWTGSGSKQLLSRITGPDGKYTTFEYDHDVGNNGTPPDPNKRPEDQWFRGGTTKMVDPLGNARARSNELEFRQWRLDNGYYEFYDASREIPTWPWEPVPDPAYKTLVDEIRNAYSITYEFDEDSYITSVTDQLGYKTEYVYDSQNNVIATVDNNGWGATQSDSAYFRSLRADLGYIDGAGNGKLVVSLSQAERDAILEAFTSHYEYDSRGNLTKQIDNADSVTTWTYTSFNKVESTTSAVGHALTVSDAVYYQDQRVGLGYDAIAANLSAADQNALLDLYTTYFDYDTRQNIIERRDPGGDVTRFEYDIWGNNILRTVFLDSSDLVDPAAQQITQYQYDVYGNVIAMIDAEGNKSESEYDPFGNLTRFVDANGGETLYTYDGDDRLLSTTSAMGNATLFAYDAVGNRIAMTDAAGHTVTQVFDVNNNLIATLDPSEVDPARDRAMEFTYDVVGNRTSIEDAEGRVTEYEFNTRRELVKAVTEEVEGEDGFTLVRYESTTGYDGVGNRVYTTDNRGFTTEFLYAQNHLIKRQTSAIGHITEYRYDANNNQIQIAAGMQLAAAKRQILKFSFDEEDQGIYQIDAEGNVSSQTYDAVGNRLSFTDGNGHTTDFEFDKNNRLVKQIHPEVTDPLTGNPIRYEFTTIYDGNSNVIEELDENGNSTKYIFDRDNRLVVTEDALGTQTIFEYDSRNNRTQVIIDGDATTETVSVTEPFSEQISYEDFEDGWGDYEPGGDDAIIYSGTTYAFEGSNAANIRDNSGTESSFISAPDFAVVDPDPDPVIPVPDATYSAAAVGTVGCTGAADCTLESWGIDLNEGTGFQWSVDGGAGGNAELYVKVAAPTSTRAMSLWLNGVEIGVISTNPNEAPRPTGKEFGPFVVALSAGSNTVELRDTEGLMELDVHNVRIVGLPEVAPPPPANDIPELTYSASVVGTAGCTGAANCTLESWGIDLNANTGFSWNVDGGTGSGGEAELWVKVAAPAGNRAMSLWVNGQQVGSVNANSAEAPRPSGKEYGPYLVNLNAGNNTVELRDTLGSAELDAHHVRVVAVQNNTQQSGQTGQPGDGPGYDFTKYDQVDMDFAFYAEHLTDGESFFVEFWDGASWSVIKEYVKGPDFNNFSFYEKHLTLTPSQYNFTDDVKFRFRGNTMDDARDVYIDQININGSGVKTRTYQNIIVDPPKDESVIQRFVYNEFNELVEYIDGVGNALLESNSQLYQDERVKLGYAEDKNTLNAADRTAIEDLYTATRDYDRVGNLLEGKDSEGRITQFQYDALNRQIRLINADGGVTQSHFDGNSNQVELIDANLHGTQFNYDAVNRLVDQTDALGVVDRSIYDDFGNVVAMTKALGSIDQRTTNYEYDLNNRLTRTVKPELNDVRLEYDAVGNRVRVIDGRGNSTDYQYDAMNRNIKVIDPLAFETVLEYDGVGNQLRIIDPKGGVREIEYDALNRQIKLTDAEQRVTQYEYDVRSNQIEVRNVGNAPPNLGGQVEVIQFEYDAENNLRKVVDAINGETINDYDRVYNVTSVVDANGNETTTEFDALNRQIKITDALGGETKIDYDAVGNRLLVTDALNNITEYHYDETNRAIEEVNARGVVTKYAYDDVDNRVSITRADNVPGEESTAEFFYDLNDRLIRKIDAENNETIYAYDENDNREIVTDARGNTTEYTFDERNLVTQILDPEGFATNYRYDENKNRIEINDGRNNSSFNFYNGNNELKISVNAEGYATTYEYDFNGNLVREILYMGAIDTAGLDPMLGDPAIVPSPEFDQVVGYEYDKLNRLIARIDAEGYRTAYSYDAVGNRLTETQFRTLAGADLVDGNGIVRLGQSTTHYFYDDLYRQTEMVTGEGYLHTNTYDAVGNVLSKTVFDDRVSLPADGSSPVPVDDTAGRTNTYEYDKLYRLDLEVSANGTKTKYEYDERSNRTAVTNAFEAPEAQRREYVFDLADRLVEMIDAKGTRTHYVLDGNGNIEQMLEAFETGDERLTQYQYDANNRQDQVTDAKGNQTRTIYDGNGNVIQIDHAFNRTEVKIETFDYDKNNRLTGEVNGELERTEYAYDGAGNRILKREGIDAIILTGPDYGPRTDIRETHYVYDKDSRLDKEINADGIVTKYVYDGAGNNIEKIEAFGLDGSQGGEVEERSRVMQYDLDNRMVRRIDPLFLGETTYTHDSLGNVLSVTDANGNTVKNTYDEVGRLVTTISQENVATTHEYDRRDNIVSTSSYLYDATQPEGEQRSDERTTRFQYDILDNQVRVDNAEYFSTTMGFDVFNNKIWERRGLYVVPPTIDGQANPNYSAEKAALADVNQEHHFEYDALDRMVFEVHGVMADSDKVEDVLPSLAGARVMAYEYDAHGNIQQMVDNFAVSGDGRTTIMVYDKADREITLLTPESGEKHSDYNVHGERIKTTELQSQELNAAEEVISQTWIEVEYEYDALGQMVAMIDGEDNRTEYDYDVVGNQNLIRYGVFGAGNEFARAEINKDYDLNNRLTTDTNALGHATTFDYDAVGNVIKKTDPLGHSRFNYYDGDNRLTLLVNEERYATLKSYDSLGNVTVVENFSTPVDEAISETSAPLIVNSSLDRRSEFTFDGRGLLIEKTEAFDSNTSDSEQVFYDLDSFGNVRIETNDLGQKVLHAYDSENRVTSITTADGVTNEYVYDNVGNNIQITRATPVVDPDTGVLDYTDTAYETFSYDKANRLTSQKTHLDTDLVSGEYLEVRFTYDNIGNKVSRIDANGNTSGWAFDLNNRETAAINALDDSILTAYDYMGNVIQVRDANGNYTTNYFDADNQIIFSVDGEGWVKGFLYDENGNLTEERIYMSAAFTGVAQDAGSVPIVNVLPAPATTSLDQVVTHGYDRANRKDTQVDGEGYITEYILDAFGNQTLIRQLVDKAEDTQDNIARWAEITRYYDSANRMTHEVSAEGYLTYYVYDSVGNLIEKNSYADTVSVPANESFPVGDIAGEIKAVYRYDLMNRLSEEVSPQKMSIADGGPLIDVVTRYTYDKRGNQTSITRAADYIDVDSGEEIVTGQASATLYRFDKANRLEENEYADGTITRLELDANGNIEEEHLAYGTDDVRVTKFEYDANNRVEFKTLADNDSDLRVTTYFLRDANGNVIHQEEGWGTQENRITQFEYDKNNRATAEIKLVNDPDDEFQVREERSELRFDGVGNQILKIVAEGTDNQRITQYEYDLDNRLIVEIVGSVEVLENSFDGGTRTEYFYDGLDNKVRTVQAVGVASEERTSYYNYDREGRLTFIKDPEGYETSYQYDVHGNQEVITDANGNSRYNEYDKVGRVLRSEFEGTLVTSAYDLRGNAITKTQSDTDGVTNLRETHYGFDLLDQQRWIVDPEGFASTLDYDLVGNQTAVTTGLYLPDLLGVPSDPDKAVLASGRASTTEFVFDKLNRQTFLIAASGSVDENTRFFGYDSVGNRTLETEAFGDADRESTVAYFYDKANRLIQSTDPEGGITRMRYNEAGEKILQQMLQQDGLDPDDTAGEIWIEHKFEYDTFGRLKFQRENVDVATASDYEKLVTQYDYDSLGNLIKQTEGTNLPADERRVTEKQYDLNNRVLLQKDAEGQDNAYTYDALGNRTSVTDARGNTAYYYFDAHGNTIAILDGNRYVSEFVYDSSNNRLQEKIYADKFTGAIPSAGNGESLISGPDGVAGNSNDRISSSTYNQNNKIKSRTDADGSHYEYFYDATGSLIREEKYLDGGSDAPLILSYEYDLQNRVKIFTDANGSVTETKYDKSNNKRELIITESTGLSAEDIVALEIIGFTGLEEERVTRTTYEYDLSNRQIKQTFDPDGLNIVQKITYDEMGNAISKTNANGAIEYSTYNRQSQIISQADGEGNKYEFVMDQFGSQRFVDNPRALTEVDDGTFTAEFEYDLMGRIRFEKQPEVEMYSFELEDTFNARPTTEHIYDEVGNEIQTIDANGNRITRYFDANNQTIAEVNGDNVLTKWTYNAFGDKTSQTLFMEYLDEAVAHTDLVNIPVGDESNVQRIDYTYDLAGRLVDTIYPDVTHVVTELNLTNISLNVPELVDGVDILTDDLVESRIYDFYGQLEKLTDRRGYDTYTWYDANGQLLAQVDAANYLTTFAYDGQGNISKQSTYTDALAEDFITGDRPSYEELTAYIDSLANPRVQTVYRLYDLASRVAHEVAPAIDIFDSSMISNDDLVALTSVSTESENVITQYTYDNAGNEISKTLAAGTSQATTEYSFYDAANRRIALIDGLGGLSTFEYDANGNRTKMTRHFNRVDAGEVLTDLYSNPAYRTAGDFAGLSTISDDDQVIENTFNALNQDSIRIERMDTGSDDDLTTRYWYDGMNQKTFSQEAMTSDEYTDSVFVSSFDYNARGNVTKIKSADGTIKHSEYDAAGNLVRAYTGEVAAPESATLNEDITVASEGLRVSWTSTETFGVQTYVVYGKTSQIIDKSEVDAQQYTALDYDYVAIPTQAHPSTAGVTISAVISDDIGDIGGGDTVYYRVVTQNTGGSLSWSEERSVVIPIKVNNIEIVQTSEETISVVVSFNGAPSSAPDLNISGSGSVSRSSLGGNSYRFDISGDDTLQGETYQVEWQSSGETFTTNSISFESKGPHYGVSTGLNEIIVPVGSEDLYRIQARTVIADEENLAELNVNWYSDDNDISGSLNMVIGGSKAEIVGDKIIFSYEIGNPKELEAADYTIVIRGVYEDGSSSVIDFIDVTVGDGSLFNITRSSASVKRLMSGSRQVFVNGERTGSTSEVNSDGVTRNVIFNLNNLEGSRDRYTILYGSLVAEDHSIDVSTTAEDAVRIFVDFDETEFDRIDSAELWIAYKDTNTNGLYSNVSAMTVDDSNHSYSIEFDSLADGDEKDFKVFYFDGGEEVVVELFRYARGDGSISRTEKSRIIDAAEYDGSIAVDSAPSDPQDPEDPDSDPLYPNTLRIAVDEGLLIGSNDNFTVPGVTLSSTESNSDVDNLIADGFSVGYYTINEYNSINARIGTNDQTGNWRTFDIDANGNEVRTLDYGEHLYIDDEVVLRPVDPLQGFKTYDGRNRVKHEYTPILEYSVDGDEWSVTGSSRGPLASYEYNALDKIEKQIDPMGVETTKEYDLAGNLIKETTGQRVKNIYYDRKSNETAVVFEDGLLSESGVGTVDQLHIKKYDQLSNLIVEVGTQVELKELHYDAFNRLERETISSVTDTDFDDIDLVYEYDHRNRVIMQTDALNNETEFQYDGRDNRKVTIDANNHRFEQKWDQLDQAIEDITPGNSGGEISKRKEYDAYGNIIVEFDEEGRSNRSVYGAFSQLKQTVDQGGRVITYDYDPWGRLTAEEGSSGSDKSITRKYDSLGRLTEIEDGKTVVSTYYEYDLAGRKKLEQVTDSSGLVRDVSYFYDAHGQMTSWVDAVSTANLHYEWYTNGNLYRVYSDASGWDPTQDNQRNPDEDYQYLDHIYYYDSNNRVTKIMNFDDVYKEYVYNPDGTRKMARETIGFKETGYEESEENQVIDHAYTYYANGWLHTAAWESNNQNYEATWEYDSVGNVTDYVITNLSDDNKVIQQNQTEYFDNYRTSRSISDSRDEDDKLNTQITVNVDVDKSGRITKSTLTSGPKNDSDEQNTYTYNYVFSSDGRETSVSAVGQASGSSSTTYDANDNTIRVDKGQADGDDRAEVLTVKVNNDGQIYERKLADGNGSDYLTGYYYANGNPVGESGESEEQGNFAYFDTGKYSLVKKLDGAFPTPTVSSYSVRRGDTLQSIALSIYGNSSLWFVLADANGLNSSEGLKDGARLTVPSTVNSGRLTSDAHVKYSESGIVGSTLPNLKSPPPKKKNGCVQILVIILVVIVAVVAAIFTAGIGGAIVGAAGAGLVATLGALALAGLVGAAIAVAANAITQGIYIAFDMQKEFDWNALAFAGAAGFVTGVAAGLGAAAQAAKASAELISYAKVAVPLLRISSAAIQQLGNDADGDGKPDWKITSWVGLAAAGASGVFESASYGTGAAQGAVKGAAGAASKGGAGAIGQGGGTISTIQNVVEYVTPWAELAESYIRYETGDNKDQPFDWLSGVASAVAGNLITAVESPLQKSQGGDKQAFSNRLGVALVNTAINSITAGVMSVIDPEKGEAFLISSVGNEVGQFIGGVLTIEGRFQKAADFIGNSIGTAIYGDPLAAASGIAAGQAANEASKAARKGQAQQEAAVIEESQSEQTAAYVSTSEPPQEAVESAAAEPQIPTITNKDGEEVPINMSTVETEKGKIYPWSYAKQVADEHAMEVRGEPATNMEINRQYRLLVELNGDEINFNRPLEDGMKLKTVYFDDNVAISPETVAFAEGQAEEYYRNKAIIKAKKEQEQIKAELTSSMADALGVSKDLIGSGSSSANVEADMQELQALLEGSIAEQVFAGGDGTISPDGLDRLQASGADLEGATFSINTDSSGNVTIGIVKNGNAIALTQNSDGVSIAMLAGDNFYSKTTPNQYEAYGEANSDVQPQSVGERVRPAQTNAEVASIVEPDTFDPIAAAQGWVGDRIQDYRGWHDTYRPESFGGHTLDAVATLGLGVVDLGEFAYNVGQTGADLSLAGQAVDQIESLTGADLPDWLPSANRGRQSLQTAGDVVVNLAQNPGKIVDGLTANYVKLWEEGRYGGLAGQVVADFGDVFLGSKGAGKAAGVASDLSKVGKTVGVATDVSKAGKVANQLDNFADVAKVVDNIVPNNEIIHFGQRRVGPSFSTDPKFPHTSGKSLDEVVQNLLDPRHPLGADDLPITAFRDPKTNLLVSQNTRTRAVLAEAGLQPTKVDIIELNSLSKRQRAKYLNRLVEEPVLKGNMLPSTKVPMTPSMKNLTIMKVIEID